MWRFWIRSSRLLGESAMRCAHAALRAQRFFRALAIIAEGRVVEGALIQPWHQGLEPAAQLIAMARGAATASPVPVVSIEGSAETIPLQAAVRLEATAKERGRGSQWRAGAFNEADELQRSG